MKKLYILFFAALMPVMTIIGQGWPANYDGVMLQGFYWDSYSDSQWTNLESEADELSQYFSLIWVPNSGYCNTTTNNMGYLPIYRYNHLSAFGTEDQLRSMISTFKQKGTGIIEDVVINHQNGVSSWLDFASETNNGKTWQLTSADICNTDECNSNGYPSSGAADTGDDFNGGRDLDHTSNNVQAYIKNYLDYLLNDLGYAGFRYDMVKGYAPEYTSLYNQSANPTYSVGEYWDNYSNITNWINGTQDSNGNIQSAAFDFPMKFLLNTCCNSSSNWNSLAESSLAGNYTYRRYGVTFVDNHDTYRDDNKIASNVLAANAFILAMPGTPCVFLPHWLLYKEQIKQMIIARKLAKINNQSTTKVLTSTTSVYAIRVNGSNDNSLVIIMGNGYTPENGYTQILNGTNYALYISNDIESPFIDTPSGSYDGSISVKLTALSTSSDAKLIYTTDGTTPTVTNGTQANSGTSIKLNSNTELKVGLLIDGTVSNVITRDYTITNFSPYQATIYVRADWSTMYFYAWYGSGTQLLGSWPGTKITATKEIGGYDWYYQSFDINSSDYKFNIIFNQGSSSAQTIDIDNLNSDKYYILSSSKNSDGKYTVTDVTDTYTDISTPIYKNITDNNINVYTTSGQLVRKLEKFTSSSNAIKGLSRGIYIVNNKKVIKQTDD